jgi:hypothetical protein
MPEILSTSRFIGASFGPFFCYEWGISLCFSDASRDKTSNE